MVKYYDMLMQDIRFIEGMGACMGCGVCTGVCPAAEFYKYDPRQILLIVQSKEDEAIEELLKSETIWYCGECMSCRPRCPRSNTPAYVIQALRKLSQELGFFVYSEKGRQQLAIKRTIGESVHKLGYCIHPKRLLPRLHVEQGPIWEWVHNNTEQVFGRLSDNYDKLGAGAMCRIGDEDLQEVDKIFQVTGAIDLFDTLERYSDEYAKSIGMNGADDEYFNMIYTVNNNNHNG